MSGLLGSTTSAHGLDDREETQSVRITVVFDNVPLSPGLETSWGFAAVIETAEHTVLFDTGGDGSILLSNMTALEIDPQSIDAVVLSHIHADHTGGLRRFLERNPDVTVYLPASFPAALQTRVSAQGAEVKTIRRATRLLGSFHSTGELDDSIAEQALIVDTPQGLIVMTGCAHPHIVNIAKTAREHLGKKIYLLMGGFHMLGMGTRQIAEVTDSLMELGVSKVAPSHCTGESAIAAFRAAWGERFIAGGCGARIEVP